MCIRDRSDGDGTATAHSFVTIESSRLSVNRGSGSGAFPLIVRRTDASGIIAEFSNSSGYGIYLGQNSATGEAYIRTATGQPLVFTTNAGSGIANERLRITSGGAVLIGNTSTGFTVSSAPLVVGTGSGDNGISIYAGNTSSSFIHFADGTSGSDRYRGYVNYSHNLNALQFGTNDTERLRISSDGYVTKPNHPSFCARHNTGNGFVNTDIICLTRMSGWHSWNSGHYSTSTGKFTAPVDGVYYFEAQAMTTGHNNGDNIQDMMSLESNRGRISYCRQRQTYFRTDENANGYFTNSVGGSIKLNATDTVWFQRKSGHSWGFSNQYYTYFTGWLIG